MCLETICFCAQLDLIAWSCGSGGKQRIHQCRVAPTEEGKSSRNKQLVWLEAKLRTTQGLSKRFVNAKTNSLLFRTHCSLWPAPDWNCCFRFGSQCAAIARTPCPNGAVDERRSQFAKMRTQLHTKPREKSTRKPKNGKTYCFSTSHAVVHQSSYGSAYAD